jgi:hypothetical protein
MGQFVTIHEGLEDDTIRATVYPGGRIAGTDDPDLVRRIRSALADPVGVGYDPRTSRPLPGPSGAYPAESLDWAVVFMAALAYQGLRGEGIGYAWPESPAIEGTTQ